MCIEIFNNILIILLNEVSSKYDTVELIVGDAPTEFVTKLLKTWLE